MYLLLIGLIVLAALLMCFVVLIQNSKGGGLASSFASSNQIMGVRKTTDFIEKLTWGLAAFMVACSVLTAYFVKTHSWFVGFTNVDNPELVISVIIEGYDGNAGAKAVPIAKQVLDSYYYQ